MMKLTPELAEICGIHAGDGYLRDDGKRRELDISGSLDEKEYYDNHVQFLFRKVFGIKVNNKNFPSRGTYGFVIRDKYITRVLHEIGFPYGKKSTTVRIPRQILRSKDKLIHARFLRGLFDTDGGLSFKRGYGKYVEFKRKYPYYPRINLGSVSERLIEEVGVLLKKLGFNFFRHIYRPKRKNENVVYHITINGVSRLSRWMNTIGIKNTTKLSRYLIWKKFGFCPTNITFKQRKDILNGKIDPYSVGL